MCICCLAFRNKFFALGSSGVTIIKPKVLSSPTLSTERHSGNFNLVLDDSQNSARHLNKAPGSSDSKHHAMRN